MGQRERIAAEQGIIPAGEHELTIVTQEVSAPESKKEVKIPDVCDAFEVPCIDTFEMLEKLGAQFTWKP